MKHFCLQRYYPLMLLGICGLIVGCHHLTPTRQALPDYVPGIGIELNNGLSPADSYAGEAMAYMLQVVVGHAGDPDQRKIWRTKGMGVALDFRLISEMMVDSQYRKSDLMVLDTNLTGLANVLYHYNPRLNQFKGRFVFASQYPSAELIAIRLLMIKKLNSAQKVRFSALLEREPLLHMGSPPPSNDDLQAMNLSVDEFQFIKDIFASEPTFFKYYKHPFIVTAMTQTGFYQKEDLTEEMARRASYGAYTGKKSADKDLNKKVTVAILPSLINEFKFGDVYEDPYNHGFKPTRDYLQTIVDIEAAVLQHTEGILRLQWQRIQAGRQIDPLRWHQRWKQKIRPRIRFESYKKRPLTIYPENAARVIPDICPSADLAIILLGKDVEKSMYFHDNHGLSATGRIFLDYADTPYLSGSEEIRRIARYLTERLMPLS